MAQADLLLSVAEELRRLLRPVTGALSNADEFSAFARDFGWDLDSGSIALSDIQSTFAIAAGMSSVGTAVAAIAAKDDASDISLTDAAALVDALHEVVTAVQGLGGSAPGGLPDDLWTAVCDELPDFLVAEYLATRSPVLYAILVLLDVIAVEAIAAAGAGRVDYVRRTLHFDRIGDGLSDPLAAVRDAVGWGSSGFDPEPLMVRLAHIADRLAMPVTIEAPAADLRDAYYDASNPARDAQMLRFSFAPPLFAGLSSLQLGLSVYPIPDAGPSDAIGGVRIAPAVRFPPILPETLPIPLAIEMSSQFTGEQVAIEVRPDGVSLAADAGIELDFSIAVAPDERTRVLLGSPFSHRIEYTGWRATFEVGGTVDDPEVVVTFAMSGLRLVLDPSVFDGFLGEVFGDVPPEIEFEGELAWSSKTGLRFAGGAGIRLEIPVDLQVGVVSLDTLILSVNLDEDGVTIIPAVSGGLSLGPVAVVMEEVGLKLALTPTSGRDGLFGPLDASFDFKPPTGFGMVIDAGAVTGGGYLYLDPDAGRYAGILQLEIATVVSVTAIGLLDTVMPDGSEGFSLLFIVSGEFPPIQLGYGFTLNGVGGLAGINRTIVTQALQDGVRTGAVDAVLFPEDPIRDAAMIISDLSTIFPPSRGQYVFGPMAILGWGTPTLLTATLGIIIELPDPIRIVLLGQLDVALPTPEAAIISLHLDIAGIIDPEAQLISIDASLRDSSVATFPIAGDMAMRLAWGDSPSFALAVGGLHPEFQPPPGFPSLDRLSIALGTGDNPRLTLQAYFAVTSNTLQIGAGADLYAEAGGFSVSGQVGFDTLIVFVPFSFSADIGATVTLKRGNTVLASVRLEAALDGPSPWHAQGGAYVTVLGQDVGVPFDATFGRAQQNAAVTADPWAQLKAAVEDPRSWSAVSDADVHPVIALSLPAAETGSTLLDPAGAASLFERVLPLNREVTMFGNATVTGDTRYDVTSVLLGSTAVSGWTTTEDYFAAAQFESMSNSQRLSRPSFERMDAGVAIGADGVAVGDRGFLASLEYETTIVDSRFSVRSAGRVTADLARALRHGRAGAAARSAFNTTGVAKFRGATIAEDVELAERWVIVSSDDLTVRPSFFAGVASAGVAAQTLAAHLGSHPQERDRWQVMLEHEAMVTA